MHVRLTEEEEGVLREGHARCYVSRICAIYTGKITEEKLQHILEKIKGKEKDFYVGLCAKFSIAPQLPLWLPDPNRPDWMPDFLLRDRSGNFDAARSTAAPANDDADVCPPKLMVAKPKVVIRPAKVPYVPKPAPAAAPAPKPEATAPAPAGAEYWSPQVLRPVRLLRPPAPKVRPPNPEPGTPKVTVPPPPPKPSVVPEQWWPPAPPKPVAIRNENAGKGKGLVKGKGKGKDVPPRPKIAPKKRPEDPVTAKAHTCMHACMCIYDLKTCIDAFMYNLKNIMHACIYVRFSSCRQEPQPPSHPPPGWTEGEVAKAAKTFLHACERGGFFMYTFF